MKQVLQNLKTGELEVAEVPAPALQPRCLLIKTHASLISSGTERTLVSFAKSSLLGKAKQQPDRVRQVIDKIRTDGLGATIHSVLARLGEPLPLGYCNCGTVLEVGQAVEGFAVGDRVASNGSHAQIVCVPKNLCAKVPDEVTDEQAAFTVLGSIGLQGIRLLKPTFGETFVVFGLGLIGLMCVQLLRRSGCKVIGIDIDNKKLELARKYGADTIDPNSGLDPVQAATNLSDGKGADGVLITASAKEDTIVQQSAQMCRKRGRIVLIGEVNLNLNRVDFYEKELTFQVSCSYGPGRYDGYYEQGGQDYPFGFVRWTEQRNFKAVLESLSHRALKVDELISERIPIEQAAKAYDILTTEPDKMALILQYPHQMPEAQKIVKTNKKHIKSPSAGKVVAGLIGAGNFAKLTLLPSLKNTDIRLKTVADIDGVTGTHTARKFGFEQATNDYHEILNDPQINTVFITTRHDLHAGMTIEALNAGKHVHVEKPLCLTRQDLTRVRAVYEKSKPRQLLVGFNRRFSPHAEKIRSLVASRTAPMCMTWLVNAGYIAPDVWYQDKAIGGGRIIGEGCHWLDFMQYVVGSPIISVVATMVADTPAVEVRDDKMSITASFADGSIGTLHYFANGHRSYPKQTFELFCDGKILKLDNFKKLRGYGWNNFKKMNLVSQDRGHKAQFRCFVERIAKGGQPLMPFEQIENVTLASFAAIESAEGAGVINI